MSALASPFTRWDEREPYLATVNAGGVSIGVWRGPPGDEPTASAPLPDWLVSVMLSPFPLTVWRDGRQHFNGLAPRGAVDILPPGMTPKAKIDGAYHFLRLSIPHTVLQEWRGASGQGAIQLEDQRFRPNFLALGLSERIDAALAAGSACDRLSADCFADALLSLFVRDQAYEGRSARAARGGLAPWQVRRISDYLEDRLAEDVTLAELGGLLDLSTFHLCRAFKQSTGLPPHRWRQQRRMERAQALLDSANDSITEIAAAVGYDDPGQFAVAFRKAFGLTPTQYRRERRS